MEIQQLKEFAVIAQCESLTKAAKKLHTSQPSLSRSLRALEDELGTTLFNRVGRTIVLNDAGRFALTRAQAVLNSAETIKRDIDQFVRDESLSVDIYAPFPMGDIEDLIIGFKQRYPSIRIRMGSQPDERLSSMTPSITFFATSIIHTEKNYLLLGEEDIVLACARTNPLAECASVELASLADQPFVRLLPGSLEELTSHMFVEAGFKPHTVAEDNDYNRVLTYVANDFGLTLAPSVTWFGRWKHAVAQVPLSDVHARRYLYIKWPDNTVMNWATLRFRSYLVSYFNEHYGFTCFI